jgi:hypothetical protein
MRSGVVVDGLYDVCLLSPENGTNPNPIWMTSRRFPRRFSKACQLLLDFRSDLALPLFLLGCRFTDDAIPNFVRHKSEAFAALSRPLRTRPPYTPDIIDLFVYGENEVPPMMVPLAKAVKISDFGALSAKPSALDSAMPAT